MPCYHPFTAYQTADGSVKFAERRAGGDFVRTLQLACQQCVGCRLERSRQWAVRCMHESQLHEHNCFVTLTYEGDVSHSDCDCESKWGRSLCYRDFQLFMKKVREKFRGLRVRFYMCGEYGEDKGRPHFHALLFGIDFPDKQYFRLSPGGSKLFRSPTLESLWTHGFSSIGAVNFQSAAYCARYIMKKVTGDLAESHYQYLDTTTGEIFTRVPEFNHMSLKPGIGAGWLKRFKSDVYPEGMVVVNGVKSRPPRYYDKKYFDSGDISYDDMEYARHVEAVERAFDNTDARLAVKEVCTVARVGLLKRSLV